MNAPTDFEVMILITALVVMTFGYTLVKFSWNQPLRNGPGFFWGIAVPEGFYAGPGRAWLRGYRVTLIALHLVLELAVGHRDSVQVDAQVSRHLPDRRQCHALAEAAAGNQGFDSIRDLLVDRALVVCQQSKKHVFLHLSSVCIHHTLIDVKSAIRIFRIWINMFKNLIFSEYCRVLRASSEPSTNSSMPFLLRGSCK